MKREMLEELQDFLKVGSDFEFPSFETLPRVPLYMEQVIAYVNDVLKPISTSDKQLLTSFMVNNYVKAKIIKEPSKKKYGVEHLGYLIAITSLKNVLSMSDISLLISMDKHVSTDKSILYSFYRSISKDITKDAFKKTGYRVDRFIEVYDRLKEEDPIKAETDLNDSLGLIAFRMAIQASVYQMISRFILQELTKTIVDKKAYERKAKISSKELRSQKHQSKREAHRLATMKKLNKKKKKEEN